MSTLGQGATCYVLNQTVSNTTPVVSSVTFLQHARILSYQLIANSSLDGSWKIEVSNDYSGAGGGADGQPPNAGTWTDITSAFSPSIATVAHGTAATQNQYVQCNPLGARCVRVTFTATAGSGTVQAIVAGGEY
jgi:hypothetical protein